VDNGGHPARGQACDGPGSLARHVVRDEEVAETVVPHACHVIESLVLNHGHSRGIELARDLDLRTLQQAVKCPPKQ
jgi:hypothetical protein